MNTSYLSCCWIERMDEYVLETLFESRSNCLIVFIFVNPFLHKIMLSSMLIMERNTAFLVGPKMVQDSWNILLPKYMKLVCKTKINLLLFGFHCENYVLR